MKEYMKPEVEIIKFSAEEITTLGDGEDSAVSNNLSKDPGSFGG